jgi:hypothetical protein
VWPPAENCVSGARAGPNQQLVDLANGDNLVHEQVDGRTAAVDDALSADLDLPRRGGERRLVAAKLPAGATKS